MDSSSVRKNHFGFYELVEKPSPSELKQYYAEKYYQDSSSSYERQYATDEVEYFKNKLQQKYLAALKLLQGTEKESLRFLDVGAGEGWALSFFKTKGCECTGLDYSNFGCKSHNPDCLEDLVVGDIYENLEKLLQQNRRFDLILLDNVLEHVLDPLALLESLRGLADDHCLLIIEVPNDFSHLQNYLLEGNYIPEPFWVVRPDHISYFNREGLIAIGQEAGWLSKYELGDFPIDFNLFNEATNYVKNKAVGKSCHSARVAIENLLHAVSPEKTNEFYHAMAQLDMGRQIIGFFQKPE